MTEVLRKQLTKVHLVEESGSQVDYQQRSSGML